MENLRVDRALEIAKEIYHTEYCVPGGIPIEECMDALRLPPLTTSLRFNQMSSYCPEIILPTDQERMIRKSLLESNKNRFADGEKLGWEICAAAGILDTWTCCSYYDHVESNSSASATKEMHWNDRDLVVVVDIPAGESVLRGSDLFIPGIVACSGSVRKGDRVYLYCDVEAKCLHGRMSNFSDLKLCYIGSGVTIDQPRYPLLSLSEFLSAHPAFIAQNIPSCVAVQVLNPQPGETVLDCCAAPGGKTLHIASLMRGTGCVVAIEKSAKRAQALSSTVNNLYSSVKVFCEDASKLSQERKLPVPYVYDRILVDAPCSGSGIRPRLSFKSLTLNQLKSCQKMQKSILKSVVPLLKSGGRLVYSTCSVFASENEDLVSWVLKEFPELQLAEQSPYLGRPGLVRAGLSVESAALLQRFDVVPSVSSIDSIGFFIALFEKKC